uniref:Uncharacterized protein n=1 Tax=Sinocyclocheilus rhinocerous TaxID=307959 RepID=A0A673J6N1_9TELE
VLHTEISSDHHPLGKLRLARLLVEGGAQVNERNQRGETPLLAACRALRGDQSGSSMLRLIQYLLRNQADPNIQDKTGHTALMYACMERAGPDVALALTAAGADPSTEDYAGASALVYAINARDQDTLTVLRDACKAQGQDIIIIATDLSCDPYVPPSPDSSPISCMSPSDIELKTNSPNSEGESIFNFRGGGPVSPIHPKETRFRIFFSRRPLNSHCPDPTLTCTGIPALRGSLPSTGAVRCCWRLPTGFTSSTRRTERRQESRRELTADSCLLFPVFP